MSNISTNKPFGIRGVIVPSIDIDDDIVYNNNISISIHKGVFEVGYDEEINKDTVEKIANDFITEWSFRNFKISVDFNQSWKPDLRGNKITGLSLHDSVSIKDRVLTTTTIKKGLTYVIKQKADSYSFSNSIDIIKKAEKDEMLSLVFGFFHNEILEAKSPKVGVYRIIEGLSKKVGGEKQLAQLIGQNKKYVTDIKQSTQDKRHYSTPAKNVINGKECIERTRKLIQAYIDTI